MLDIDLNDFTLGEVEEIEATAGVSFTSLFSSNRSGLAMAACLWVTRRRDNPEYTLEDAKGEKLRDINIIVHDADPTSGDDSETD